MSKIRDEISKVTDFYFTENVPLSKTFITLAQAGRLDKKVLTLIVGVLCDYLESIENKKK